MRSRSILSPVVFYSCVSCVSWFLFLPAQEPPAPKLLIAFASFRERPKHPKIYFYEHDGVATGKIVGSIDTQNQRSDYRPALSHDGRFCAFAAVLENQTGRILYWDRKDKKLVELPKLNDSPNAQMYPTLSADGRLLAFTAWNRPSATARWDLLLYDVIDKKFLDLPGLNTSAFDERMPAFNGNGRFLAFISNHRDGVGLTDIRLYDREDSKLVPLPGLNSPHMDVEPSLSADGRLLAFVSERVSGEGERDLFLYDRRSQRLLPTPGLNAKQEDFDPCVIVLKADD